MVGSDRTLLFLPTYLLSLWKHYQRPEQVSNLMITLHGNPTDQFYNTFLGKYMYSRRQGHLLKMKPLQVASVLKIAELVGRSNLCSSKGVQIPPDRFTQMLEYCRDLRASGDLKKIWNMEPPALVKNPSLWTLKHICDRWGGV